MTRRERFRLARRDLYEGLFSSRALCITGLIIMPALLFNPNTLFRILQFLFFWLLAWLSGKKNNPLITLLVILGIVAFNLLVPYGEVILSLGVFRLTAGALMTGIQRAVTLEALIMLSRFSIRRDLKFPGAFGELIGESFRIFALIMDRKGLVTRKNIVGGIDALLLELSETPPEAPPEAAVAASVGAAAGKKRPPRALGVLLLAAIAVLAWLPVVFSLVYYVLRRG